MERACSLSSTHRIVFLGFMGGTRGVRTPPKSFFSYFLRTESDVHANGNHARSKVARSPMARSWSQRSCHTTRAATTAAFCSHVGECQFAAENFYTISTDTHIDYVVIFLCGAHKNATRTVHFESLFDHYLLIA